MAHRSDRPENKARRRGVSSFAPEATRALPDRRPEDPTSKAHLILDGNCGYARRGHALAADATRRILVTAVQARTER